MTELETALARLGAEMDFPPTPSVAPRVRARLEAHGRRPARFTGLRLVAFVLLATLVPAAVVLAASPGARDAVLELFRIRGATIERVRTLPVVKPQVVPPDLGEEVSLAEARRFADFAIPLPERLGPPDHVYVEPRLPGGLVNLAWDPTGGRPASGQTGVGLLLTLARGSFAPQLLEKQTSTGTHIERLRIAGEPGYLLSGRLHTVFFQDAKGQFVGDDVRLAGKTLAFERGPLFVRIEAELPRAEMLSIAESLR